MTGEDKTRIFTSSNQQNFSSKNTFSLCQTCQICSMLTGKNGFEYVPMEIILSCLFSQIPYGGEDEEDGQSDDDEEGSDSPKPFDK